MPRSLPLVLLAIAIWLGGVEPAWAQSASKWPSFAHPFLENPTDFPRGPGFYYSLVKMGLTWALFLIWLHSCDWVNQDAQRLRLNHRKWNPIVVFPFVVGLVLLFSIPNSLAFWVGFPLMVVAYVAPFVSYVIVRNKGVLSDADMVFTAAHIRYWLSVRLAKVGIKIAAEAPHHRKGPPIDFHATAGASKQENQTIEIQTRQLLGLEYAHEAVAEVFDRRGEALLLEFSSASVAQRFQIDGVWHSADPLERPIGDAVLQVLKQVAGLDPAQRAARQQGAFAAEYGGQRYQAKITSQGVKGGERVLVQIEDGSRKKKRLPDLGLRQKMLDELKPVLDQKHGIVLLSSPPGHGLSTLFSATVASMDRYVRGFVAVEEATRRELEVENVPVTTYDGAAPNGPMSVLPKLAREYPDVYAIADPASDATVQFLSGEAEEERLVITCARAKDAVDGLLKLLAYKAPVQKLAPVLLGSLNQRLMRKLCEKCKEPYPPPAEVLKQLGLPAGRIEAFYRPPQPPQNANDVCEECGGLGYKGRVATFELLIVDDVVRELLRTAPQAETIRRAARKTGLRSHQEEGIVLVAKGITSLPELMRSLKE